jgi:hypothetical protein
MENTNRDAVTHDAGNAGQENNQTKNEAGKKDSVSYDTYSKVLARLKASEAKIEEFESKMAEAEANGDMKKLNEKLTADLLKSKGLNKDLIKSFSKTRLEDALKMKLSSEGCIDNELAIKALDVADWEPTENFSVDEGYVAEKISAMVSAKPHLFKRDVIKTADLSPTSKFSTKSLSESSLADLWSQLK